MIQKILIILMIMLGTSGCSYIVKPVAGNFHNSPEKAKKELSSEAQKMIEDSYKGIDLKKLRDVHVHVVGLGKGGTGIWINPKMKNFYHFKEYIKYKAYMSASGVTDSDKADQQYMERLEKLIRVSGAKGKYHLLAFDRHYNEDQSVNEERSTFYVPNEYVYKLYLQDTDVFEPVISVHPYKKGALKELERWGKKNVKFVKWLPNAMGMDPASERIIPYYKMMKKYNMVLLTHVGEEKAVDGEEFQKYGNPLRFKRPLEMGVKIIMAHIASLGKCKDSEDNNIETECFDLFWRLFTNKKYEKNLFAEVSAVTMASRVGKPLDTILSHPKFHHRLVNGSDYPLPAVNILFKTGKWEDMGYINKKERAALNEIYKYNPLLFDFVSKRVIKHPKTGQKFKPSAFELPEGLL